MWLKGPFPGSAFGTATPTYYLELSHSDSLIIDQDTVFWFMYQLLWFISDEESLLKTYIWFNWILFL